MKIALVGYGKMGKAIEKIAIDRGHTIKTIVDKNNSSEKLGNVDVTINFCTPKTAVNNITNSFNQNIPVVSGTTGWINEIDYVKKVCLEKNTAFLYSSNFSLGVNIFFSVNKKLANIINKYNQYDLKLSEIHHEKKIDKPSGTAIQLANDIIKNSKYVNWTSDKKIIKNHIPIKSIRSGDVTGTHTVNYSSKIDSIRLEHIAHNRHGFALGAVIAAEWIIGKNGIFTLNDVLDLN